FFFQAEDGIRDRTVTGVQTCALPISDYRVRAPIDLHIATNEIVATTHSFPEPVTRHNHLQIRVWPAFLSVVKPAHERPNTHKRRSEERRVGKEWRAGWRPAERRERGE